MIKHLRIDNRLIHGQVAVTWLKYLSAKAIIICNDKVSKDPIEDTIKYEKEHPDENIFVIAKFPSDALAILEAGVPVETVNVGNAAPIAGTKYVMIDKSIAATAEDAVVYRKIAEHTGGVLTSQLLANSDKRDFLALLKKAGL